MDNLSYPAYLLALAAGMLTPGPAMLQALSLGLRHGARPVAAAALGNVCATLAQVAAVLAGLAFLAREPLLLRLISLAGAAYLGWLGLCLWRAPARLALPEACRASLPGLFAQGLGVAACNPKAWGFLAAMLPRFAASGAVDAATLALTAGPVCLLGFGGMMAYARFGAWLAGRLASPAALRRIFRLMAAIIWACAVFFAAARFP